MQGSARWLCLTIACVLAAACGGGGSSSPAATAPPPGPPPPSPPPPGSGGLDQRPSNLTCVAPAKAPGGGTSVAAVEAFPSLPSLNLPLALFQAPGDDTRWFAVEKTGRVRVFANDPNVSAFQADFIDLTARVDSNQAESGLLGLAFHPDFAANGEAFLSFTAPGLVSVVSRFTSLDGGATLDPGSEEIIIQANQDFGNHNGGGIGFGPDGYLYIGLGDGGSGGDPNDRAQDTTNLLGAMLRVDVDGAAPYAIPADNPFAGNPGCPADHSSAQSCPEIYAWGLRNPWRWSFDRATNVLWAGDVGQGTWEEVDQIELGGNYGWDCREGANPHGASGPSCATAAGLIDPVHQYVHGQGNASITGGYVYRGSALPALFGRYVFGDFGSGRIWALSPDGQGGFTAEELLNIADNTLASFAEGNDGELYVVDIGGGRIQRLAAGAGGNTGQPPVATMLSGSGCVDAQDPTQPDGGLIPYDIQAPFWSDNAEKERWLAIPDGTTITVDAAGDFDFPNGTVLMKHFRLGGQLIETRLFMRHPDGEWAGYGYEWDALETDATLVQGGKVADIGGQDWIFPSGGECMSCHTEAAGFSLGLEVAQLNRDFTYPATGRTDNQLLSLDAVALFTSPLGDPALLPMLPDPADGNAVMDDRARAHLHSNCSNCHRPGLQVPVDIDLRVSTALADTNACDVMPSAGDLGIANARLIAPGDANRSVIAERASRRDAHGMPPLASGLVHADGVTLLRDWINGLAGC